ncbi:MAG: hypothetical protein HY860_01695 [Chlamydiales bacterium]|nr:hypothetical protein [Chlamydiales bacterium]
MNDFFFSGSVHAKLDEKNRVVLPQSMRYGLIEAGKLEFTVCLGLGGCLSIYKQSEIMKIVKTFQSKQHVIKFQKFFTMFFSTLHTTTCDTIGRLLIPPTLKKAVGITEDIVIAGVLNKIEIWPKAKYEFDLQNFLSGDEQNEMTKLAQEAFSLVNNDNHVRIPDEELAFDEFKGQ